MIVNRENRMLEIKDLCKAYLEGYIQSKVTECLIRGKVLSSDLDKVKEMAVKCMEDYVSHQSLSDEEKENVKEIHKQWANMVLKGIKQRLYDSNKIERR